MEAGISPENIPNISNVDLDSEPTECALCGQQSICGGTGVVRYEVTLDDPRFGKLFRCPNYQVSQDSNRQEKLRRLSNLYAFSDKTFAAFKTDNPSLTTNQQESLRMALRVSQKYAETPEGWLLIEGTYGCGKSHLAAAVGNYRLLAGDNVLFITSPDLLDHLRGAFGPNSELAYDDTFDRVRNAPMLILDDLGVENPSAWAMEKLFQLLNYRYTNHLATVVTTNVDLDLLDPRLRSRLLDDNIIRRVKISAPDYRTPVQMQRDSFWDLGHYREMTFENFDTVSKATPDERVNLTKIRQAAREYADNPNGEFPKNWIVFVGEYGTGKTHLAAAIANQCNYHMKVMFVSVPDLLDYLRMTYNPSSTSSYEGRFQLVRTAELLVLDDLGTESATPWAKEKLFQIIDYRYRAHRPTVLTLSKKLDEMDGRLISRLVDQRQCDIFLIQTRNYSERIFGKWRSKI
jgi:DNA replication protein DnaC